MSVSNIKQQSLPWTGERYLPDVRGGIELEHLHRYLLAKQLSLGKRVLDIASGEGYGAALLSQSAISVVGVDISEEAVAYARTKYQADNLEYKLGSCSEIPLSDHSVDVVVSFETIEHHNEHSLMMSEIKRVLIQGGILIISSPDKLEYSDRSGYVNPYHVKELYRGEFESLLHDYFVNYQIAGQRLIYGSAIFNEIGYGKVNNYNLNNEALIGIQGILNSVYLVAIASDGELPLSENGILERPIAESDLAFEMVEQVTSLRQMVAERDNQLADLNQMIVERDNQLADLNQMVVERDNQLADLNQMVVERDNQLVELNQIVFECDEQLLTLNRVLSEREAQIIKAHDALSDCESNIVDLNCSIVNRDVEIMSLLRTINDYKFSSSWKLTSPLRFLVKRLRYWIEEAMNDGSLLCRVSNRGRDVYWYFQLKNCPLFDKAWYLSHNPDVLNSKLNPLWHYVVNGWREQRRGGIEFDDEYYRSRYPDVAKINQPPLIHYWRYGRFEGRYMNPLLDQEWLQRDFKSEDEASLVDSDGTQCAKYGSGCQDEIIISVVIPTYNRFSLLPSIIDSWREVDANTNIKYEIIFSDDGSEDGSAEFLESVADLPMKVLRNSHGGASLARNSAIKVANGNRLLLIGDDIFPDPDIINIHASLGMRLGSKVATLGAVDWHKNLAVNYLMHHITEIGNEQFSFNRLKSNSFVDFRHFYTCNICVPRDLVLEQEVIFDERFDEYGFEDIELGYRLALQGMKIYFTPEATGAHFHPYTIAGFCRRQLYAGRMAVVFAKMHPAVADIIGVNNKLAKPLNKDAFWQNRVDLLVERCEYYEELMENLPPQTSMGIRNSLSIVYTHLFRAMYEYGVLQKKGTCSNPLSEAMEEHFSELDDVYYNLVNNAKERLNILTMDELFNLGEALNTGNASDLLYGVDQRMMFDELMILRSFRGGTKMGREVATNLSYLVTRTLYYLVNNPRYLVSQLKRVCDKVRQKKYSSNISIKNLPAVIAPKLGLIIGLEFDQSDIQEDLVAKFHEMFGPLATVYRLLDNNLLELYSGSDSCRELLTLSEIEANILFWPSSLKALEFPDRLFSAYLAVVENGVSIAVISHSLVSGQTLSIGSVRDHLVFSREVAHAVVKGSLLSIPFTGKVLRLLPAWGNETEQNINSVFGCSVDVDNTGFFRNHIEDMVVQIKYGFPWLQSIIKQKPIVFVFPIFLAVGGVERNTIEIMRRLKNQFDFVVITMERLRPEQGSLAAQAIEVASRVIELSEIVNHDKYLRVLTRLKSSLLPDLVWVCNGSPWFCDNAISIRKIFYDVPILDQEVYDVEQGWITRYTEPGIQSFDGFIAVNRKIERRFLSEFRIDPSRVHLIYSVIDTQRIRNFKTLLSEDLNLRQKFCLPENKRLFTFVGRLTLQKRPIEFLKLVKQHRSFENDFFVLVGDGELDLEVQEFIDKNSLLNVKRIPYIENTLELNAISSGILFTSAYEGLPIAMLEAIAMGVPCFATDVGDIGDVLSEFHGGSVVPVDLKMDKLYIAFCEWLERREEFVENLKAREHDILERFSSENIAKQYQSMWQTAMSNYQKRGI